MMAGFMSLFGGRKDSKQSARDAIVTLRQQLQLLEKKEEHLQRQIDDELQKAKANVVSNKTVASNALKRKKRFEEELTRLNATRLQLDVQVNTLESANLNAETLLAMKKGSDALKSIHKETNVDKVGDIVDEIAEQRALAEEISNALLNISPQNPEEEELNDEMADLEKDVLDERLAGANHVPVHIPPHADKVPAVRQPVAVEDDEEAQLRELRAALSM